jgi:hypothetical protein
MSRVRVVGPVIHGVECYEAWRDDRDCPHEADDAPPTSVEPPPN